MKAFFSCDAGNWLFVSLQRRVGAEVQQAEAALKSVQGAACGNNYHDRNTKQQGFHGIFVSDPIRSKTRKALDVQCPPVLDGDPAEAPIAFPGGSFHSTLSKNINHFNASPGNFKGLQGTWNAEDAVP